MVVMSFHPRSQHSGLAFPAVPLIQPVTLGRLLPPGALLSIYKSLSPKLFPVICFVCEVL